MGHFLQPKATSYENAALQYAAADYTAALDSIEVLLLGRLVDDAEALNLACACARQLKLYDKADAYITRAIELKPDYSDALYNYGNLLRDEERYAEAEVAYRRALRVSPTEAETLYALGLVLHESRRYNDAITANQWAIALRPDYTDAYTNLGNMFVDCGRHGSAAVSYGRAVILAPHDADKHYNLGTILERLKNYAEAGVAYRFALSLRQNHCPARWKLAHMQSYLCDWHPQGGNAIVSTLIDAIPDQGGVSPFQMLAYPEITALQQLEIAREIARKRGYGALILKRRKPLRRQPSARLRIGYLSADFHDHATTRLLAGVLEQHDRSRFAVYAYSYGPAIDDAARQRVTLACEHFRDVSKQTDRAAADQISSDSIDILVDLKGYTAGSRLGITARRPAPVIVSWLGYPGTLGESTLADYIIGDPIVSPLRYAEHFSEALALLPHSYQPNDRSRRVGALLTRAEVGLPETGLVFCNFNQSYKLNAETFDVWCRLLRTIPDSILWLLRPTEVTMGNLRREAERRGVASARLIFAPYTDSATHLQRLQCADLALDTYPYGSHTTGSDALWAGVPLITRLGETFASRVAGSLLNAVGLPELVTDTWDEYFDLAQVLARDRVILAKLRSRLADQRLAAPLFDTVRFTLNLERLYIRMWQNYSGGIRESIVLTDSSFPGAQTQPTSRSM